MQSPISQLSSAWSLLQLRQILSAASLPDIAPSEIPALIELARVQSVAPYLYWKLRALGADMNAPAWQPLDAIYQTHTRAYLDLKNAAGKINAALTEAGIPAIWLKGFALAHSVYPEPALRHMVDLDVLVPFAQRRAALECMQHIGYTLDIVRPSETLQDMSHDYHLQGEMPLELHYRLLGVHSKFFTADDLAWFWAQTRTFNFNTHTLQMFAPEAQVLHLCAHAMLNHSEAEFLLQRFLDLHLVITTAPQLDWNMVVERARALRWTYAVERALDITRTYFGTPIPEDLTDALAAQRPNDEDNARAFHNFGASTPLENARNYLRGMSAREKLNWVKDSLLPSRAYMQWRYHPKTRWQMLAAYPYRWFDIVRHIAQTVRKRL